jgi:RNA polymerase sigma factor for flagellar operon FliA
LGLDCVRPINPFYFIGLQREPLCSPAARAGGSSNAFTSAYRATTKELGKGKNQVNAASKTALSKKPAASTVEVQTHARRDELMLEHMPLVTAIAAHIQKSIPVHVELDDLIHAGIMGLFDAATKYRDDKEVAFPTYAKHRIRGAILDSLRQQDWASRDLRKRYKQVEAVTRELTVKLERSPTDAEIANHIGLSPRRWQALMVDFRSLGIVAVQQHPNDREDHLVPEATSNPELAPDRLFARGELRGKLDKAMKTLPERYQQVVKLYYERDMTMKEIGGVLGVNESRVSQIHKCALERMQSVLNGTGISSPGMF